MSPVLRGYLRFPEVREASPSCLSLIGTAETGRLQFGASFGNLVRISLQIQVKKRMEVKFSVRVLAYHM